jgi:hypothetical protein
MIQSKYDDADNFDDNEQEKEQKQHISKSRTTSGKYKHTESGNDNDNDNSDSDVGIGGDFLSDIYGLLHMVGAIGFVVLVTSSIIVHDYSEMGVVGGLTGLSFVIFSLLGYLTGKYFWLLPQLRCIVMLWNPFVQEPQFMAKLQRSMLDWVAKHEGEGGGAYANVNVGATVDLYDDDDDDVDENTNINSTSLCKRKTRSSSLSRTKGKGKGTTTVKTTKNKKSTSTTTEINTSNGTATATITFDEDELRIASLISIPIAEVNAADAALDSFFLKFARYHPIKYLHTIGRILVMSEMIALLTPCVAVGLHWVVALCDSSPITVIIDLCSSFLNECVWDMNLSCDLTRHCILRQK